MMQRTTTITGAAVVTATAVAVGVVAGTHHTHRAAVSDASAGVITAVVAHVGSKTETILTDAQGMPLYYYLPDAPTRSAVSGGLAALWPPLTAASAPTARGFTGTLTVVHDSHGSQVAYNGHLLYTFVSDRPGVVTGQGIQNFQLATPRLSSSTGSGAAVTSGRGAYGGY